MMEPLQLRWAFIRKVYSIISVQLLATIAVATTVVSGRPIAMFFVRDSGGLSLYILVIITPFIWKVILESVILTTVAVVSLTVYTFWAARRGIEFNFLGPFLFGALLILIVFGMIQLLFPLGRTSIMVYGCLASINFCGYIIYDTGNLLTYSYDITFGPRWLSIWISSTSFSPSCYDAPQVGLRLFLGPFYPCVNQRNI